MKWNRARRQRRRMESDKFHPKITCMRHKQRPKFKWNCEEKKSTGAKSNLFENKVKARISAPLKIYKMYLMRRSVGPSRLYYASHSCSTQCCFQFGRRLSMLAKFLWLRSTLLLVFVSSILCWQTTVIYLNDGRVSIHSVVSNPHKKKMTDKYICSWIVLHARVRRVPQSSKIPMFSLAFYGIHLGMGNSSIYKHLHSSACGEFMRSSDKGAKGTNLPNKWSML